jgi:hypothetical protein
MYIKTSLQKVPTTVSAKDKFSAGVISKEICLKFNSFFCKESTTGFQQKKKKYVS